MRLNDNEYDYFMTRLSYWIELHTKLLTEDKLYIEEFGEKINLDHIKNDIQLRYRIIDSLSEMYSVMEECKLDYSFDDLFPYIRVVISQYNSHVLKLNYVKSIFTIKI